LRRFLAASRGALTQVLGVLVALWTFGGSCLLFNLLMIDLLWGDTWLASPTAGIAAVTFIVIGWLVSAYFLFKHLRLSVRGKTAGWLFVVAFVGYSIARRFSSYYIFHSSWSLWLISDAIGLFLIATFLGLAILILGKRAFRRATPYTVESEAPDHVLHVSGKPNYSLKRTAADRLR
jgi:hypothetical protein